MLKNIYNIKLVLLYQNLQNKNSINILPSYLGKKLGLKKKK